VQPSLFPAKEQTQLTGAGIVHLPGAFTVDHADKYLAELLEKTLWQQEQVQIFGQMKDIPRLTAWHGDPGHRYAYSGIAMDPLPWTNCLLELKAQVEQLADTKFNSVLLNLYRTGSDSVAWHADDEPELGAEPIIGSVSLGATRKFQLKRRDGSSETIRLKLEHGDAVIMRGGIQRHWLHQVPKTKKPVGPRINLTFDHCRVASFCHTRCFGGLEITPTVTVD
jgi:alkylated DNA repair dioxygenase AlkB